MKNDKNFNLYKNFLDLIPDPLLIVDKESLKIFFVNHEFQIHFGKSQSQFQEISIDLIFNKDSFLVSNLKKLKEKVGMFLIKEATLFKNFSYEVKCIIPEDLNKYILMIFKKIEDDRKIDDQSQYTIFDETFSILSHEINNPLSSIKMASQIMTKSKIFDKELFEIISSETERITKIFKSLSFINSKINLLEGIDENIHEVIRYSIFRLKKIDPNINIIENFDPSLPLIKIDKSSLIQVFDNLLLNSKEALDKNFSSYIKITTKFLYGQSIKIPNLKDQIKKNFIQITIEDNGRGVEKNDLEKVFIPFFSKKKNGTGIGLFLVKKIIDYHNGQISIYSDNDCTKVYIKLPL